MSIIEKPRETHIVWNEDGSFRAAHQRNRRYEQGADGSETRLNDSEAVPIDKASLVDLLGDSRAEAIAAAADQSAAVAALRSELLATADELGQLRQLRDEAYGVADDEERSGTIAEQSVVIEGLRGELAAANGAREQAERHATRLSRDIAAGGSKRNRRGKAA